ncbi:unnamed protein product [Cuscuta epithymum]|uniref:Curli production assembly/transport component CsgG n=1 Tax=Cuscuta epithymum TaxID=186058 RepID=A0AAV0G0M9_9ASTE|nr:unnamed protein product [Cuscuta epithymum]
MIEKKRVQFLLAVVIIALLSITAEKCREVVGKEAASKSGDFNILNCLDGGTGTLACVVKEGVKLYFYNIRSAHIEKARNLAIEKALADAISQAKTITAKQIQLEGAKAAKLAKRQANRIVGPIISSGWDFFEAIYLGGTMTEAVLRSMGTLSGTYYVGFLGEASFGRIGYFVGSELGSWVGGRVGLMLYDLVNGMEYVLEVLHLKEPPPERLYAADPEEETIASGAVSSIEVIKQVYKTAAEILDKFNNNETPPTEVTSEESTASEEL